jgi:hypothetical protein
MTSERDYVLTGHIEKTDVDGITAFTVFGSVDRSAMLDELLVFLTNKPTKLVIWDVREGDLHAIRLRDWRVIVKRALPFTTSRIGGRTAIISKTNVRFRLTRALQSLGATKLLPFDIGVFPSFEKAREWLAEVE